MDVSDLFLSSSSPPFIGLLSKPAKPWCLLPRLDRLRVGVISVFVGVNWDDSESEWLGALPVGTFSLLAWAESGCRFTSLSAVSLDEGNEELLVGAVSELGSDLASLRASTRAVSSLLPRREGIRRKPPPPLPLPFVSSDAVRLIFPALLLPAESCDILRVIGDGLECRSLSTSLLCLREGFRR